MPSILEWWNSQAYGNELEMATAWQMISHYIQLEIQPPTALDNLMSIFLTQPLTDTTDIIVYWN